MAQSSGCGFLVDSGSARQDYLRSVHSRIDILGISALFPHIAMSILREDLLHPLYGGNKWRKLKYNLLKARETGHDTILTFGGPWSNHIAATAAACAELGMRSIGIIRGEAPQPLTQTLEEAQNRGMRLVFVSRAEYAEKDEHFFIAWLRDTYGPFYLVPEGGANYLGVQGCTEILGPHTETFDLLACAAGTGTTAAGLLLSLRPHQKLLVFSALKGEDRLTDTILRQVGWALGDPLHGEEYRDQLQVITDYHFGGYGRYSPELLSFMKDLEASAGFRTDHVYTGKMFFGLADLAQKGVFAEGAKVLAIHTGGMQGLAGLGRVNPFS